MAPDDVKTAEARAVSKWTFEALVVGMLVVLAGGPGSIPQGWLTARVSLGWGS
jgi:hypothetical protein